MSIGSFITKGSLANEPLVKKVNHFDSNQRQESEEGERREEEYYKYILSHTKRTSITQSDSGRLSLWLDERKEEIRDDD